MHKVVDPELLQLPKMQTPIGQKPLRGHTQARPNEAECKASAKMERAAVAVLAAVTTVLVTHTTAQALGRAKRPRLLDSGQAF
jgi:hypothetical protein